MKSAYRILAYVIAAEVIIQAAAIAYAIFGLGAYIQGGGVMDKAAMESETTTFTGDGGFPLHGINGEMIFPLLVLILLVLSFFAKVPRGVMWAGVAFGLTVLQIAFALLGRGLPFLGILHGANALLIFGVAVMAAMAARGAAPVGERTAAAAG
jgi:Family of unknown function (DUF6220)